MDTDAKRGKDEDALNDDTLPLKKVRVDPFVGPSNQAYWTRGTKPDVMVAVGRPTDDTDAGLPAGDPWIEYDSGFLATMNVRRAAGMKLEEWARMGYWRGDQFALLFALSARVPDFKVCAFIRGSDGRWEIALRVQRSGALFVCTGEGVSKTKAKQAAGSKAVVEAGVMEWIAMHHATTVCDDHLRQ